MATIKTEKQALKEAVKRWGKKAAVRLDPKAGSAADREAARATLQKNRENKGSVPKTEVAAASSCLLSYRCTVGYVSEMIPNFPLFHVEGQGDTWAEAFENADEQKKRRGY